jgi:hypothetical protein
MSIFLRRFADDCGFADETLFHARLVLRGMVRRGVVFTDPRSRSIGASRSVSADQAPKKQLRQYWEEEQTRSGYRQFGYLTECDFSEAKE